MSEAAPEVEDLRSGKAVEAYFEAKRPGLT
jgi:hypothetical protein